MRADIHTIDTVRRKSSRGISAKMDLRHLFTSEKGARIYVGHASWNYDISESTGRKHGRAQGCHICGDMDVRQIAAAIESIVPYLTDAVGKADIGEPQAGRECITTDAEEAVRNHNIGDRTTIYMKKRKCIGFDPGCSLRDGDVRFCLGTGDQSLRIFTIQDAIKTGITRVQTVNGDGFELETIIKHTVAQRHDIFGQVNIRQTATTKGVVSDADDAIWNEDIGKVNTGIKRTASNVGDALRNVNTPQNEFLERTWANTNDGTPINFAGDINDALIPLIKARGNGNRPVYIGVLELRLNFGGKNQ